MIVNDLAPEYITAPRVLLDASTVAGQCQAWCADSACKSANRARYGSIRYFRANASERKTETYLRETLTRAEQRSWQLHIAHRRLEHRPDSKRLP